MNGTSRAGWPSIVTSTARSRMPSQGVVKSGQFAASHESIVVPGVTGTEKAPMPMLPPGREEVLPAGFGHWSMFDGPQYSVAGSLDQSAGYAMVNP